MNATHGQFCSAQAMLRSIIQCGSGIAAGLFIDFMKWIYDGSDYAYRFNFAWSFVFMVIGTVFFILLYREWNRLGGDKGFHPPAPWSPEGFEEIPITHTIPPSLRWLKMALRCFDGIIVLSVLFIPVMMWWMHIHNADYAFKWYGLIILPSSIMTWILWAIVKRSIYKDVLAAQNGEQLHNGIPHHGMLLLVGLKFLILLGVWVAEVIVTVYLEMPVGALAFGVTRVVTNLLLIGSIWLICRIERGYSTTIDSTYSGTYSQS